MVYRSGQRVLDRKCQIIGTPEMGYWTLYFNKDELLFDNYPAVRLPLRAELQKVGMFVDYDEGLVSLDDVETRVHLLCYWLHIY